MACSFCQLSTASSVAYCSFCGGRLATTDILEGDLPLDTIIEDRRFAEKVASITPDLMYVFDVIEQRYRYVNDATIRFLGLSREELLAPDARRRVLDRMHPEERSQFLARLEVIIQSYGRSDSAGDQLIEELEYRLLDGAGRWRWLRSWRTVFARTADGRVRQILGISHDVTERKRAEQDLSLLNEQLDRLVQVRTAELLKANEDLRRLVAEREVIDRSLLLTQFTVDRAVDSVFWVAPDAEIVYVNDAACRTLGYRREELVGKTVPDINPNFPANAWPAHWEEVKRRGSFSFETDLCTKEGKLLHIEVTVNYIRFEGREYNCAMVRDITERKRAESALRESEVRYRTLFETCVDSVFLLDVAGRILAANPQAAQTHGYTPEELLALNIRDLNDPVCEALAPERLRRLKNGESLRFEVIHRRKDGTSFPLDVVGTPMRIGEDVFILSVDRDISEQKRNEEQFAQLHDQLAHACRLRTMGEMASGLAHELNQPLSALSLYASTALALGAGSESERLKDCLRRIEEQTLRAGEIVRRMRAFVGRGTSRREPEDIHHLIHEVLLIVEHDLRHNSVATKLSFDDRLPRLSVDGIQIQQVLVNLIRNAVEAMPGLEKELRVLSIRTERLENEVRVSVSDTGCGLDPSIADKLFQPFQTTKTTGLGLGLSLCRTLIQAHGGGIGTQVNPAGGTTFYFTLPLGPE